MRTASIVVGIAVILAVLAFLFQDSLFTSGEQLAEEPAPAGQAATQTAAVEAPSVESQARAYITKLTETQAEPIPVKNADHFVSKDQIISLLPESAIEFTTPKDLARNPALKPDTPITVIRTAEQIETVTPEKIIAESGGDLNKIVKSSTATKYGSSPCVKYFNVMPPTPTNLSPWSRRFSTSR